MYLNKEELEKYKQKIFDIKNEIAKLSDNLIKQREMTFTEYINKHNALLSKLDKYNKIIDSATIIEKDNTSSDVIDINDVVRIKMKYSNNEEEVITYELIVGDNDLNCPIPKLSINSPLGNILYLSKLNDTLYFYVNKNKIEVTILEKVNTPKKKLVNK